MATVETVEALIEHVPTELGAVDVSDADGREGREDEVKSIRFDRRDLKVPRPRRRVEVSVCI